MEKKKSSTPAKKTVPKKNATIKSKTAPKKPANANPVKAIAANSKSARMENLSDDNQCAFPQRFMHMVHNFFDDTFDFSPMTFSPRSEIRETKTKFELSMELPGVEEKDVAVAIDNDSLIIKGEKHESVSVEEQSFHTRERRYGSFYKRYPLPPEADVAKISGEIKNGVLIVNIPKTGKSKTSSKKIPLKKS